MAKFATGKNALAISDRSGLQFPYREMVKEWTGALVHYTEFEAKQPQLQPIRIAPDPQALQDARPARVETPAARLLTIPHTLKKMQNLNAISRLLIMVILSIKLTFPGKKYKLLYKIK